MPPVPHEGVRRELVQILNGWRSLLLAVNGLGGLQALQSNNLLAAAVSHHDGVGLGSPSPPFLGYDFRPGLRRLLQTNVHLASTCVKPVLLAAALDVLALNQLQDLAEDALRTLSLDAVIDRLIANLFEEDYQRLAYFRLYNLQIAESPITLPGLDGHLESLSDFDIPRLIGESTPFSMLHYRNTGNVFLVLSNSSALDDSSWWTGAWKTALKLVQVLRYVKYSVIDVDYSVLYFRPSWVNQIRRYGIAMWGHPRTDVQSSPYVLSPDEQQTATRYHLGLSKHAALVEDPTPKLRRALLMAGDYYEGHYRRTSHPDRLIDLSIALEALYSPPSQTELSFRIAHSAALLLGSNPTECRDIASLLSKAYTARSTLVHGSNNPFVSGKFSADKLDHVGDLVRQSIIRFSVLLARGEKSREAVLAQLQNAMYDPAALDALRRLSDVNVFLDEQGL